MSTDSVPPTSPQGVLFSLLAEDRPWTVEEMIREKGEGSRVAVVDALAELEAMGLVTRINKRVMCASRAALKADELSV
jgi:predicted transcriptional regulator